MKVWEEGREGGREGKREGRREGLEFYAPKHQDRPCYKRTSTFFTSFMQPKSSALVLK